MFECDLRMLSSSGAGGLVTVRRGSRKRGCLDPGLTGVREKNPPPEKNTPWKISFPSTKCGAGEQLLPKDCLAKAPTKGLARGSRKRGCLDPGLITYYIILYHIILYHIISYYIEYIYIYIYYTILHYIILYYTMLYYTVLYFESGSRGLGVPRGASGPRGP